MGEKIERIIYYLLGAMRGIVVAYILESFHFKYFCDHPKVTGAFIGALLGIMIAMIINIFNRDRFLKEDKRLRDEVVTLITHEMRTGLTSTSWAIQLILEKYGDNIDVKDKKMLENVISSIYTTTMHSVNLLDESMLDAKKLLISLKWMKLGEIEKMFNETFEKYSFGAKTKGIDLKTSIKLDHDKKVEVDLMRLRVILENLLENSFQYTTGDGGKKKEIDVKIENTDSNLTISVSDTGIGIPRDEQEKVFSEFYRASNARRVLSNGSGIGLFMSYQYIQAHHGKISFVSEEGKGTTFNISIPLWTSADTQEFLTKI